MCAASSHCRQLEACQRYSLEAATPGFRAVHRGSDIEHTVEQVVSIDDESTASVLRPLRERGSTHLPACSVSWRAGSFRTYQKGYGCLLWAGAIFTEVRDDEERVEGCNFQVTGLFTCFVLSADAERSRGSMRGRQEVESLKLGRRCKQIRRSNQLMRTSRKRWVSLAANITPSAYTAEISRS